MGLLTRCVGADDRRPREPGVSLLDANDVRETVETRPVKCVVFLASIQAVAQPDAPDDVHVCADSGQEVPTPG